MNTVDFRKATLQQLSQILRFEDCEPTYKVCARLEIKRRVQKEIHS